MKQLLLPIAILLVALFLGSYTFGTFRAEAISASKAVAITIEQIAKRAHLSEQAIKKAHLELATVDYTVRNKTVPTNSEQIITKYLLLPTK